MFTPIHELHNFNKIFFFAKKELQKDDSSNVMDTSNDLGDDNNNNNRANGKSPDTCNTKRHDNSSICTDIEENKEPSPKIQSRSVDNTPPSSPEISYNQKEGDASKPDKVEEKYKLPSNAKTVKTIDDDTMKDEITDSGENDILARAKRNLKKVEKPQNGYDTRQMGQDFATSEGDKNWNKKKDLNSDKSHEGKKIAPPKNVQPITTGTMLLRTINIS